MGVIDQVGRYKAKGRQVSAGHVIVKLAGMSGGAADGDVVLAAAGQRWIVNCRIVLRDVITGSAPVAVRRHILSVATPGRTGALGLGKDTGARVDAVVGTRVRRAVIDEARAEDILAAGRCDIVIERAMTFIVEVRRRPALLGQ